MQALSDLSERLYCSFRHQVRLVVHSGTVMVLHPSSSYCESTQDVDYIHWSFVSEYKALGFPDVEQRLRTCIMETACKFSLGADWMNDHADVALPWALEHVHDSPKPLTCLPSLTLLFYFIFIFYLFAANKDSNTILSTTPRPSTRMRCNRPSSMSAALPLLPFPGHGPSRSNWCTMQSKTQLIVPLFSVSVSRNAASTGHSLASSSGSWSVVGRWAIPGISPRRSSSSVHAYRMPSVACSPLDRTACLWHGL